MTTGYVWHSLYGWHDTGSAAGLFGASPLRGIQPGQHFEHPDTKRRLHELVESSGLLEELTRIEPVCVEPEQVLRVHDGSYLEKLREASASGGGALGKQGSSPFGRDSYDIALLAAGGTLSAASAVLFGAVDNAYALVRPPGHHATRTHGMGFCLLNNIAITAAELLDSEEVGRIAVVDWDVHHGNGTQQIFYDDPRVLTISLHQDNNYPANSGGVAENGEGAGTGTSINVPLPPGSGNGAYRDTFDRVVLPALERFDPDLIMVAAGYDAGAGDPLGRQMLSTSAYRVLTRLLLDAAWELSAGRLVFSHEGGYDPNTVPFHGLAVIEELAGIRTGIVDPYEPSHTAMGQQDLQSHQRVAIDAAAGLVGKVPSCRGLR
ncbi:class II histone deacetylase [Saccharopolyspora sp. SCSIO 74807]|uniref:class II histone deacetylase n=1 Tax=Saccharopolyspora sp. SCSIO 74807 TaxID=3118084 RepID=UPI0030D4A291